MKRFISLVIVAIMIACSLAVCFPAVMSAESLYIKKIVSVVYDDSGSMKNDNSANWAYASYAMQSFCGLMNSDDRLFITYMSAAEKNPKMIPPEIDLSASKIQDSVNAIRTHTNYGNTPYNSVDIAFNKLKSVNDSNKNTQYWLVVITDGEFQGGANGYVTEAELNTSLSLYSNETMPNGSNPQITYLAIGDNAVKPRQNVNSGIYVYTSSGSSDIINVMSDIADKVSGRSRLSAKDIISTDSKTIKITSSVPLLNIAVLSQNTSAKVVNAQYVDGNNLIIGRSAYMKYPERNGWNTDTSLNGGAFVVGNNGQNINTGTYTIHFDSDINLNNVIVLFEPALEVRMSLSIKGESIENFSTLGNYHENDIISATCKIYEIGTDSEISPSLLPTNTSYDLGLYENGKAVKKDETSVMSINGVTLHNSQTEVKASITIPGFVPISIETGVFTPKKPIVYTLEVKQPDDFTLTTAQMRNNTQKIYFIIKADGVPVSRAITETLDFKIDTTSPGDTILETDGSISFTPRSSDLGITPQLGKNTVTCILNETIKKEGVFFVTETVYTIEITEPDKFSLTISQLKNNADKIVFVIKEDGVVLSKDMVESLDFSVDTLAPGTITYEDDGSVSFTPQYKEPASLIPTGDIKVTGSLGNNISKTTFFYVKPLEYTVIAYSPDDNEIIRSSFNDNVKSVTFEVLADGEKLDKDAVEAENINYSMNEPYNKRLKLKTNVNNDGTITVTPKYDKCPYFALFYLPKGELHISIECNGADDTGYLLITNIFLHELFYNVILPLLILIFILFTIRGEYVKNRFNYNAKIYYNEVKFNGSVIMTHATDWEEFSLNTFMKIIPDLPDRKTIRPAGKIKGCVKFYADNNSSQRSIYVKRKQCKFLRGIIKVEENPINNITFSFTDTGDEQGDVKPIINESKHIKLRYGEALVTNENDGRQIYLYSEKDLYSEKELF